ncbi:MAG TPA: anhydro-N-acetylmuramic acid kinase, partial [Hyphomicrobiales bacterium]|nr:anhydro-N-acetylmuramic acid kinase [Hyphomicrobiales bacterium]
MTPSLYIGLISGTSMDGIDCALVDLQQEMRVLDYHCAPLPPPLRDTLLALCANQGLDLVQLGNADVAVGQHFADAVLQLLAKRRLKPTQVAAIGSHGQTLWHQPPQQGGTEPAFT